MLTAYIAHPMSLHTRVDVPELLQLLDEKQVCYLLPEDYGPDLESDPANKKEAIGALAKSIAEGNKRLIERSQLVIACIDDRDAGVMFEIGYADAHDIPVITFSRNNFGSNIMISHTVLTHFPNVAMMVQHLPSILKSNLGHVING